MALVTVDKLVSDIELLVYQGDVSDDSTLEHSQIKFWLSYYTNQVVATECNSKLAKGEQVPSIYVKVAQCEPLTAEDVDCGDDCEDRVFVEIDDEILTLNKDAGVVRVITDEGDIVVKGFPGTMDMLHYMPFAAPSIENIIYYREGKKFYLEGFKTVDIPFNKLNIWYVPKQNLLDLEDTDEVLLSDLALPQVMDLTLERAKQELYGSVADATSDGVDPKNLIYHQAIQNPANQ